jgi:hypothetical protein
LAVSVWCLLDRLAVQWVQSLEPWDLQSLIPSQEEPHILKIFHTFQWIALFANLTGFE